MTMGGITTTKLKVESAGSLLIASKVVRQNQATTVMLLKTSINLLMKRRRKGSSNFGIKQDVTIINSDFKQDYKKWLSQTLRK